MPLPRRSRVDLAGGWAEQRVAWGRRHFASLPRARRLALLAATTTPLLIAALAWLALARTPALPAAPPAPPPVAAGDATRPADARRAAYDAAVRELEAQYPALDAASPEYSPAFADRAAQRTESLIASGLAPADARRRAVAELVAEDAAADAQAATAAKAARRQRPTAGGAPRPAARCVYKDIMTDADYLACGARPPTNIR